jgi:hypothetical protein
VRCLHLLFSSLEQNQLLLGHTSALTIERYVGYRQNLGQLGDRIQVRRSRWIPAEQGFKTDRFWDGCVRPYPVSI